MSQKDNMELAKQAIESMRVMRRERSREVEAQYDRAIKRALLASSDAEDAAARAAEVAVNERAALVRMDRMRKA